MSTQKPRVVKDFEKLSNEIKEQIKLVYPYGFVENLISYTNKAGALVSALPFETDEVYYLIRMTSQEAIEIIDEDDDYDDGILKDKMKDEYSDKYSDLDYVPDLSSSDEDSDNDQEDSNDDND